MKTLETIQKLSKLAKILSKIVYVVSMVGMILCLIGIPCLALIPEGMIKIGGVSIHSLVGLESGETVGTAYAAMGAAAIYCGAECYIARRAKNCFEHELSAGTPFTFEGAAEILKLGIYTAAVSLGAAVAAGILRGILSLCFEGVKNSFPEVTVQIGTGIAFILFSLLMKLGAEQKSQNTEQTLD